MTTKYGRPPSVRESREARVTPFRRLEGAGCAPRRVSRMLLFVGLALALGLLGLAGGLGRGVLSKERPLVQAEGVLVADDAGALAIRLEGAPEGSPALPIPAGLWDGFQGEPRPGDRLAVLLRSRPGGGFEVRGVGLFTLLPGD